MSKMMNKCYKCKWRRSVPGSAHSRCDHPDIREQSENSILKLFANFASVGRIPPYAAPMLGVKGDSHGIKNGWFNWPWNFDPVWLDNCDGFTPKEADNE